MNMNVNLAAILPPDFQSQLREGLASVSGGLALFVIASALLLLGWLVALGISRGVQALLAGFGFDAPVLRLQTRSSNRVLILPSRMIGYSAFWSIFLASCIVALRVVGLDLIPSITARLQDVVPRVLTSALVLLAGVPLAIGAARILNSLTPASTGGGARLRYQIIVSVLSGFVVLLALEQLGLAAQLVVAIGVTAIGTAGLGLALAFGLGCRDLARDLVIEYLRASETHSGPERP